MTHLASLLGLRGDRAFEAAYWEIFDSFFGKHNAPMVKATLLARVSKVEGSGNEVDRVCLGLRQTMGWAADAIERKALEKIGQRPPEVMPQASENRATT